MLTRRELHFYTTLLVTSIISVDCLSHCPSDGPRGMTFTISSKKNQTGHWTYQVQCKRDSDSSVDDCTQFGDWFIDVRHFTKQSEGGETVDIVASLTSPPASAGPGFEKVPGLGYYKLHTTPKTWPEARDICNQEGAYLGIVNSEKELKALQGIFALHPNITAGWQNYLAFLGFHDLFVEGEYVTIFGDPLESTGYSHFDVNEPTDKNGSRNENCGALGREGKLHDVSCDDILPFFCEQV